MQANTALKILLGLLVLLGGWAAAAEPEPRPVAAVDISRYPEIRAYPLVFYDLDNRPGDFLEILRRHGINTIRLRLWVHPADGHSGLEEVKAFAHELRRQGFRIWLAPHYSDAWADPGHQQIPRAWQHLGFEALRDTVYRYTARVVREIHPDYIQIGNEINNGFLHPYGHIQTHYAGFLALAEACIGAVRDSAPETRILLHYAGLAGALEFFERVRPLDYDIIGLSYYPWWHGKSLDSLRLLLARLSETFHKEILIAETAYPFTLAWNDWTHNIVGSPEQLILPDFPATPEGQRRFVHEIRRIVAEMDRGLGFCYWGAELIAWKGPRATDASPWENLALFDFENRALPVLLEFRP